MWEAYVPQDLPHAQLEYSGFQHGLTIHQKYEFAAEFSRSYLLVSIE